MQKFELIKAKGYVVFKSGEDCILVDTGSPLTFTKLDNVSVNLCGELCKGAPRELQKAAMTMLGFDLDKISRHVDCEVTMLMGADNLLKYNVLIDMPGGEITFSKSEIAFEGSKQKLENVSGYTLVNVSLNGKVRRVFLDTGAPISYVNADALRGCARVGECDDYSPMCGGHIHTELFNVPVTFAGKQMNLECGLIPASLSAQVALLHVEGVVGGEIFANHKVLLDFANSVAKIA